MPCFDVVSVLIPKSAFKHHKIEDVLKRIFVAQHFHAEQNGQVLCTAESQYVASYTKDEIVDGLVKLDTQIAATEKLVKHYEECVAGTKSTKYNKEKCEVFLQKKARKLKKLKKEKTELVDGPSSVAFEILFNHVESQLKQSFEFEVECSVCDDPYGYNVVAGSCECSYR